MVELQIVILAVAGSSPVGHPARDRVAGNPKVQIFERRPATSLDFRHWGFGNWAFRREAAVAQPVLFTISMINPELLETSKADQIGADFWLLFLNDEALRHYDDL